MIYPQYGSLHSLYIKLTNKNNQQFAKEEEKFYLMLKPKNKTVLDIGAYNGDTARLFLDNGAKYVICVEKNKELYSQIRKNVKHSAYLLNEAFNPEKHLRLNYDAIKCDIEGFEILLLGYKITKPIVLEVHNWYLYEQFKKQGYEELTKPSKMLGLCMMGKNLDHSD